MFPREGGGANGSMLLARHLKGLCHGDFADFWPKLVQTVLKLVVANLIHIQNIIFEHQKEDI